MRAITKEWVEKAESDFGMAHLALCGGEAPITDGACFHSQQCAEKYLKLILKNARLIFREIIISFLFLNYAPRRMKVSCRLL